MTQRRRRPQPLHIKPICFVTSAILAGTAPVRAQQTPSQGNVLEEVIVTSQKRSEDQHPGI